MFRVAPLLHLLSCCATPLAAQVLTSLNSLAATLRADDRKTYLSGYSELKVQYDMAMNTATANHTRNMLFVGHRFNRKFSFCSEMEPENASVEGGAPGELSMEQLFLKFNINKDVYPVGGLFILRIGVNNENHLPTTFNGNDRPFAEQMVIPSTWREVGAGLYGRSARMPGLNWSVALQYGFDASAFAYGSGIREGRQGSNNASASTWALPPHCSTTDTTCACRPCDITVAALDLRIAKRTACSWTTACSARPSPCSRPVPRGAAMRGL